MPDSQNEEKRRAFNELVERLYPKLRALAARVRWHGPEATQPTALLHNAYLKLLRSEDLESRAENEIIGIFAHVMRQIMVDAARKAGAEKRGGGARAVPLVSGDLAEARPVHGKDEISPEDVLTVDAALTELRLQNPRQADIMERRYFLGMTSGETASVLAVSLTTVEREWREGKKFLRDKIRPSGA
jgi:RNA polymerase sigma factor (TIGR02999 family)